MTSWDRSRFIPWSRLQDVSAPEYENAKEHLYRKLNKEAAKEKEALSGNIQQGSNEFVPPEVQKKKSGLLRGVDYNTPDLIRSMAFGGSIGSITGAVFGFMDGMRTAGESPILKKASNMAKGKFLMQGTTRAAGVFGVFFAGFHSLKYGIKVAADPGIVWETIGASAVGIGALSIKPAMRANIPYAGMLIGMDIFSNYMRETQ